MKKQNEVKEKGVTAKQLLLAVISTSFAMVALGLLLLPYEKIVGLFVQLPRFSLDLVMHLGLFLSLGLLYTFVFYTQVLDKQLWHYGEDLRLRHNNSQIIMTISLFAVAGLPIAFAGGSNLNEWLFLVLLKSAISHMVGMLVQVLMATSVGVRTLDKFKEWMNEPSNDSHAYQSGGFYVLVTLVVSALPLTFGL